VRGLCWSEWAVVTADFPLVHWPYLCYHPGNSKKSEARPAYPACLSIE
jgi:hypothetical protein